MPPSSKVSTRSVKPDRRSASQSRAGLIASRPWLEMLGKLHSSFSSSTKRRELLWMYVSTALVDITPPFLHWLCDSRRLPLFPAAEPRERDRMAAVVGGRIRRGEAGSPSHTAVHLRGVVPLVPRDGRDDLLQQRRHRPHQGRVRSNPCRQRRAAGHQPA